MQRDSVNSNDKKKNDIIVSQFIQAQLQGPHPRPTVAVAQGFVVFLLVFVRIGLFLLSPFGACAGKHAQNRQDDSYHPDNPFHFMFILLLFAGCYCCVMT